jgi:hypothetical protein
MTVLNRDSRFLISGSHRPAAIRQRQGGKEIMKGCMVVFKAAQFGLFICVSACGNHATSPSAIQNQPPSTPQVPRRAINGIVREVNGSSGLGDVTIRAFSRTSGAWVPFGATAADGSFHLEQLVQEAFSFTKTGYEIAGWTMPPNAKADQTFTIVVKMQPTLQLAEGRPVESVITSDDLAYSSQADAESIDLDWPGNVWCSPCKLISVQPQGKGGRLRLSSTAALTMWVADYYSGPILVATGDAGAHELVVDMPADRSWNTVLIGLNRRDSQAPSAAVVTFRLALVDP